MQKVPTGVPGLDIITNGGLPRGRTTLLTGKSGAAKSILALQLASHFARSGIKTMVFSVEETPADLTDTGNGLGFGTSELVAEGKLRFTDLTLPLDANTIITGDYDVVALVHRIEAAVSEFGAQAIVLDSATALFSPRPPEDRLRHQFFELIRTFRRLGLMALVTAEAPDDYGPRTTLGVEDFLCDVVLVLRNLVDDERRRRTLEVHKYRRSAHQKGEYPCTITSKGVMVFPFGLQGINDVPPAENRFSSGFEGLDTMMNGGWLRDSITLVRGPSGSGKTTLAGMYARAGASRGERVAYYGFEETRNILLRNFASLGLPLDEFVKKGNLRVECSYPEATSPEDLLVELRRSLDEYKPSLIVLDSISSIAHSTSARGFRQFMVGFAALVREHSRSALLSQTLTVHEDDTAAPFLSTIPDAIISLDYERHQRKLTRTISVVKMRGSAHAEDSYTMHIRPGGLTVEAPRNSRAEEENRAC
ncbi:circadian clock protein KaiC [Archangium violaceum]|uniref:circadian clock protein KaiC n=1 Tax=Archangium violaceum TaxID=83451 RepID=UPI00193B0F0F|nr:circadian clock protein KaiC [Archangium violaceum]QRK04169.1 circadian clock protein KaiC [Archangium violaceum]